MSINIGSFGARLTRDQTVADGVWTKVVFNEVSWDTLGGFDHDTGGYTVGCAGKFHFAAGVRFLAPDVPNRGLRCGGADTLPRSGCAPRRVCCSSSLRSPRPASRACAPRR